MRSFSLGLFAGLLLAAMRAPLGLELLQVPATTPGASMAYRAAALLVIALGLVLGFGSPRTRLSPTTLLCGAAVGFPLHAQLVDSPRPFLSQVVFSLLLVLLLVAGHRGGPDVRPRWGRLVGLAACALGGWLLLDIGRPESHGGTLLCALVGLFCLVGVGRLTDRVEAGAATDEGEPASRLPRGGLSGIAVCGAGLAILCEGLARHLRLLGEGLPEDDGVFGAVFLGLATFGSLSFARLFTTRGPALFARATLAAASGLAAWGAFEVLENLSSQRGLEGFLRQFEGIGLELDTSMHGMWRYDAVVAAPVLVACAFVCGTVVGLHRRTLELAALLLGAAAGLVLSPGLLSIEWDESTLELATSSSSAEMALFGGLVAAGGALLVFFTASELGRVARLVGCAVAFGGVALCRFPERQPIQILSPWERREAQPLLVVDGPAGLLTIERDAIGEPFATLDRRAITPPSNARVTDRRLLGQSFEALGPRSGAAEDGAEEGPKVLFVGQLDPDRALQLSDLGAARIDRTASWHRAMAGLEAELFDGRPSWFAGEVLSLTEARARLDRGEYDLVIVPPRAGMAPTTRNLASGEETAVVVWFDGAGGIETQHLGERVLLSAPGLTHLYVAVVHGPRVEELDTERGFGSLGRLDAGEPTPRLPALELLETRKDQRRARLQGRLARRLAEAELAPGVATGLAILFEAQVPSSPFQTEEMKIELPEEATRLFAQAAAGEAPTRVEVEVAETLAHLFRLQRRIEEIEEFFPAPAERHAPWPALEVALAQAALELLDPGTALEHVQRAHAGWGGTVETWAMQAEAEHQLGRAAEAAGSLERALTFAPGHPELERRLAIAWRRAGDPRGEAALREALEHEPEDPQLLALEGDGPYPAAEVNGYHPPGADSHAGHDH